MRNPLKKRGPLPESGPRETKNSDDALVALGVSAGLAGEQSLQGCDASLHLPVLFNLRLVLCAEIMVFRIEVPDALQQKQGKLAVIDRLEALLVLRYELRELPLHFLSDEPVAALIPEVIIRILRCFPIEMYGQIGRA